MTNVLDSYRDPEPEGGRRRGRGGKRRRPTDWLNGREGRGERALVPDVEFESYYGKPVVKAVPWGPQIPTYLFFGGLAGGSQLLASGAYLTGNAPLRRATRLTTFAAVSISGAALIEDLGRPERFYNMMRVAKFSSPMSVGTWIFSGFSGGAMPGAGLEILRMLPLSKLPASLSKASGVVVDVLGVLEGPTTALGAAMAGPLASYTAVLLSNTATPTWQQSYKHLPFVFAGSASAASGGNAMMWTPVECAGPARVLALIGSSVDLVALNRLETHLDAEGVLEPLHHGKPGKLMKASMALNIAGISLTLAGGWRFRAASVAAGACFAAGSVCTRFGVFYGGIASANDPKYTMEPQRRRLEARGGTNGITTVPSAVIRAEDGPRTADGRRPLPGPDGPTNL